MKTKQTRFARKRRANQNIPPSALVDSFLEQLQNLVLIFCWRLKTVAALADHEFFVEGLSAFLLSSTAGWTARTLNVLLSGETDHRAL